MVLLAGAAVGLLPLPALAQRVQSNVVLVREDDVITEDLYAAGNTIVISGVIEGDLIAAAFDAVRIDGVVEGDVLAISDRVEVSGRIDGSLRVGARVLEIDGMVAGDVFVGSLSMHTGPGSEIGRDALVWTRTADLLGEVGRDIEGSQGRVRVGGTVAGDVEVTADNVTLLPRLVVGGDVHYTSERRATIDDSVAVEGAVIRREALPPNVRVRGVRLLVTIIAGVAVLGLGIGLLWAAPERSLAAARALRRRPLAALAWGVGVASVPVAIVIVVIGIVAVTSLSSSGPLVLVMLPLAVALAAAVLLGLFTAPVPVGLAIGGGLRTAWSSYARFVLGFAVLLAFWLLPWVGGLLTWVFALAGLGSWLVAGESQPEVSEP